MVQVNSSKLPNVSDLLVFQSYPVVYTPRVNGIVFNSNLRCNEVPNPRELAPDFFRLVGTMDLGLLVPFVQACDGSIPTPHGTVEDEQLTVGFKKGNLKTSLSVEARSVSSSDYSKGFNDTFYYNNAINLSSDSWTFIDEHTFSFIQTIQVSDTVRHINTTNDIEDIENSKIFKRIFTIASINNEGITRLVYSLPLADYAWIEDNQVLEPELTDQLQVQISESTLTVTAISNNLTDLQQSWVGTFAFNDEF
jgi:hypothetical protein